MTCTKTCHARSPLYRASWNPIVINEERWSMDARTNHWTLCHLVTHAYQSLFISFFSWRPGLDLDRITPIFIMIQRHFSRSHTDLVFLAFTFFSTHPTPKPAKGSWWESVIPAATYQWIPYWFLPKICNLGARSPSSSWRWKYFISRSEWKYLVSGWKYV